MTEVAVMEKEQEKVVKASPATSITIPVVPSLVTVGNIAVTSVALTVSSGVAGPAAAIAAAATGMALVRHHKGKRPGARTFGTKRSISRMGRSSGGFGRRGSAAGRLGRFGRRLGGKAAGSLANSRIGRAVRRAGKALSPVGRVVRRAGKALSPVGRAVRGASRGVDRAFRGAGAGLSKAGRAAGLVGRFARRVLRPGERRKHDIDASRDKKYNKRHVGKKVNEPPKFTKDPTKPTKPIKPTKRTTPVAKGNGPSGNKGPMFSGSQLAELAKTFASQAGSITHRGNLETCAEANDLPMIIGMFADTLRTRVEEYRKSSIHPDYVNAYANLCSAMDAVADMSRQLAPAFVDMHKDLIGNLVNSPAPEGWDSGNNGI